MIFKIIPPPRATKRSISAVSSSFLIIQIMLLHGGKGFFADHVFDAAGILGGGFFVNAESHQHIG